MSGFSERLRDIMREQGVTAPIISDEIGIPRKTFTNYTSAISEPKFSTLCAISDTLGVNLHWLLTGEGPMDLPSADQSSTQTPPVDFLPVPDRGAEPARTASRAGIASEGAQEGDQRPAPSAFSAGFVDVTAAIDVARLKRRDKRARALGIDPDFVTFQGAEIKEIRPPFWKQMSAWLGGILGCANLLALLFLGHWVGEILA